MSSIRKIPVVLIFLFWGSHSFAGQQAHVVVELFTSQGCSSCPPADAFHRELSTKNNVLALAFHVDYWDYIGWKDSFAHPIFSKRQKTYARLASQTAVYTPQFMINGQTAVAGSEPNKLRREISKSLQIKNQIQIALSSAGNQVQIDLSEAKPARAPNSSLAI